MIVPVTVRSYRTENNEWMMEMSRNECKGKAVKPTGRARVSYNFNVLEWSARGVWGNGDRREQLKGGTRSSSRCDSLSCFRVPRRVSSSVPGTDRRVHGSLNLKAGDYVLG
jgi:hypothetical protein